MSPVAAERFKRIVNGRFTDESGQDLLEYGLLVALIAIVALVSVGTLGTAIRTVFWDAIASNV
jgi:Flp pilus assembly pilin Flp